MTMQTSWQSIRRLNLPKSERARDKWEASLVWYRVRYDRQEQVSTLLLGMNRQSKRLGLRLRDEGGVVSLFIGVPSHGALTLENLAAEHDVWLEEAQTPPSLKKPYSGPMKSLPIGACDGMVLDGLLFTSSDLPGAQWPVSAPETELTSWYLPDPVVGTQARVRWQLPLPDGFKEEKSGWLLGRSQNGDAIRAKRVSIYATESAFPIWLEPMLQTALSKQAGIVVLDLHGELFPKLRHLSQWQPIDKQDNPRNVVNPLKHTDSKEATLTRWHTWFAGMGVSKGGLGLLEAAFDAGVKTLAQLANWLTRSSGEATAVSNLRAFVLPLIQHKPVIAPIPIRESLAEGNLLIRLPQREEDWLSKQQLRALLLQLQGEASALLLHRPPRHFIQSNWPLLADFTQLAVTAQPLPVAHTRLFSHCSQRQADIANKHVLYRANWQPAVLAETLVTLTSEEALLWNGEDVGWVSWR